MNRVERRAVERVVQAAVDGTAAEVNPREVAPLHLAPRSGVAGHAAGPGHAAKGPARSRRGVSRPVAAIGAAAAVVAMAAASYGAASALRADRAEVTRSKPAAGPLGLIPRYFVELDRSLAQPLRLAPRALVVDSTTGKVVTSVRVPRPDNTFEAVSAAADDRTFVLLAAAFHLEKNGKFPPLTSKLLVLRLRPNSPAGFTTTLSPVRLHIPVNWQGQGLAVSPDGTKVAFAASPFTKAVLTRIWGHSMVTGATRSWQDHDEVGSQPWDGKSLSWSPDDKTLAYLWHGNAQVNLLNTNSAGGGLLAHSRRLITFTFAQSPTFDADLTPDGKKVIASIFIKIGGQINEYSAATGRLISNRVLTRLAPLRLFEVLWTNDSGSAMILDLNLPSGDHNPVRVLHGGKLIKLKGILSNLNPSDLAW